MGCAARTQAPLVAVPPPAAPTWTFAKAPAGRIWGVGSDHSRGEAPLRLQRDLADAAACDAVRGNLRAHADMRSSGPGPRGPLPKTLGAALGRATYPGCRIVMRECRVEPDGRRWCWSRAELDSSDVLPVLERQFPEMSPAARDSLVRTLLAVP
jgi:hypothetical protein